MLDLKWIRQNPEELDTGLARRGHPAVSAKILELDQKHRSLLTELQDLQNSRNDIAKQIGMTKSKGEDATPLMDKAQALKDKIPQLEEEAKSTGDELQDILVRLPNLPFSEVPEGDDETFAQEIRVIGKPKELSFKPKTHFEIGESLGLMDFETAAKISGARFVLLKGDLCRLERALASFMLDMHTQKFGYQEVSPPYLVKSHSVFGTGQLPKFKEDLFETTDERWLIPTAEIPLTNMVRESVLEEEDLPLRYTAYTPCFRSEAGSAGKDTRGMIRQHQFTKVELVSITHPSQSKEEHERLVGAAEEILKELDIPYRLILLAAGDMGASSHKTYDIEVWLPSENRYREISSCSNCGDYQARRMNARFKPSSGGKPEFVHTLNGSGLAVGRTLIAVLENYQQEDGSVIIPDILVSYMNGQRVIKHAH